MDTRERARQIWEGLLTGSWSLVDHFDADGKRFMIASKNVPGVDKRAELTPQERRVSALAASGQRDKEIADALGLSMPSVIATLHRARAKLGVRSRADHAILWRTVLDERE